MDGRQSRAVRAQSAHPAAGARRRRRAPASRRWLIPPAMLNDPGAEMSELGILLEHSPRDGLLLWNLARDLALWAVTPAESRTDLFAPGTTRSRAQDVALSSLPLAVATWLDLLVSVVYGSLGLPDDGLVTETCTRLVGWARSAGKAETALSFAQAAALAEPMAADAALLAGVTAAAFARFERADSWLHRAIGIGRRVRDRRTYSDSFRHLGDLARRRGDLKLAEVQFKRALKAARRCGYRAGYGEALIGLVQVATETGRFDDAVRWEELAGRAVSRDAAAESRLARASVDLWMWRGDYKRALQGLERVRLDAGSRADRMLVLARIAHAAAALGEKQRLIETWTDAWEMAQNGGDLTRQALFRTYLELQRAAEFAGDAKRAAAALRAAGGHVSGAADEAALAQARNGRAAPAAEP